MTFVTLERRNHEMLPIAGQVAMIRSITGTFKAGWS